MYKNARVPVKLLDAIIALGTLALIIIFLTRL